MDVIDRSAIPDLHAAARRHRSVYVACLFNRLVAAVLNAFKTRVPQTAPCA